MSARPGYDRGNPYGAGGPGQAPASDEDYRGEWAAWVDQPAAAAQPPGPAPAPEPDPDRYEDHFSGLIDRSPAPRARRRLAVPLLGTLGLAALAFAAYLQFGTGGSDPQAVAPAPSAPATATAPVAQCPAERVGNRIQGNGAGGFDSGPAVIFAFQHAYYVTRSGEQVRSTTTADAAVQTADAIQRGIDSIPAGTTHCVAITPGAFAGQYIVVITEHRPGQQPVTYNPQLVTTAKDGDRTLISAITRA